MAYKRTEVVVLIGKETDTPAHWVKYEIQKAWSINKPVVGIRIHGLSSMGAVDSIGGDPFADRRAERRADLRSYSQQLARRTIDFQATYSVTGRQHRGR